MSDDHTNPEFVLGAVLAQLEDLDKTQRLQVLAEAAQAISKGRKVWIVEVPEGDEYGVGPTQVLIEQFGSRPPTVAFRRDKWSTWGRPYSGEEAP